MQRRSIAFGFLWLLVGALTVLGAMAVKEEFETGPGTVSGTCKGGLYGVTLAMGTGDASAQITAQVLISDAKSRQWQVRWYGYEDYLPIVSTRPKGVDITTVAHVFQALGDLDDGDERDVWLRPEGSKSWCQVSAHLH